MTFEPAKCVLGVLEFFASSGVITSKATPIPVRPASFRLVEGDSQKYEQLLFMLVGHMIPEFTPQSIDFLIGNGAVPPGMTEMITNFQLPPASAISLSGLRETLATDERLRKLAEVSNAVWIDQALEFDASSRKLCFSFPVRSIFESERQPAFDLVELKERFEDEEAIRILVDGFIMNANRHVSMLISAVEKQDWTEAHRHAHTLKGGALNICAEPVGIKAKQVEFAIKEGRLGGIMTDIEQLSGLCNELVRFWDVHREKLNG